MLHAFFGRHPSMFLFRARKSRKTILDVLYECCRDAVDIDETDLSLMFFIRYPLLVALPCPMP